MLHASEELHFRKRIWKEKFDSCPQIFFAVNPVTFSRPARQLYVYAF
jgi:hypothetical protein